MDVVKNHGLFQKKKKDLKIQTIATSFSKHWHNHCYQIDVCSFFKVAQAALKGIESSVYQNWGIQHACVVRGHPS
ncbi:MAG TPA: hypothetical protein DCR17_03970 [Verrucomicrobiales bacterium]|nr:hypothetical protein [Verrucomicrobiales bacterium]HAW02153.1 hypothetical protein [Verrucomicrobiales bacterium]HCZ03721.1 hypothetical protein [Verrucomicrobiales bacterium]